MEDWEENQFSGGIFLFNFFLAERGVSAGGCYWRNGECHAVVQSLYPCWVLINCASDGKDDDSCDAYIKNGKEQLDWAKYCQSYNLAGQYGHKACEEENPAFRDKALFFQQTDILLSLNLAQ